MRILYVEDNPLDADLTVRALKRTVPHFIVDIVNTQKAAISILDSPDFSKYDLVLTDMNLPDGDGLFIVSHIRLRSLPLGIVLLTGQGDEETAVSVLKAGADDYVSKRPGYLDHLHICLENAYKHYLDGVSKRKKPIRVLYVEHHEADIDLTCRHFERHAPHIQLDTAKDGSDLLARLSDSEALNSYNVLLLDYRLPRPNAIELMKEINLYSRIDIPIILITGKGDEEVAVEAFKLGASDYVVKNSGYLYKLPSIIENAFHSSLLARQYTALKQSEEKYRSIFENAVEGLFQSTPEGRFVSANPAFAHMLGYESEQDLIAGISDIGKYYFVNNEDWHHYTQNLHKNGSVRYFEFQARCRDGSSIWVSESTRAIYDTQGKITIYEGYVTDITQRKQAEREKIKLEEQYRQAQKMESVGRLAGGVAHDYNNALSVIMGYAELSLYEAAPTGRLHGNLTEILNAAKRAANITRQLLAFARKQTIAPIRLDVNKIVENLLKMVRRLIGEDIDLVWQPEENLWPVKMDPSQIDQLVVNLCVNARDAIKGVGKIIIETKNMTIDEDYCEDSSEFIPGDFIMLGVSDNGCGMDREIQEKIFEPFFTTKDVDKGTGLGLSTVYGIVKQNNGFININSEPGKGTTIKLFLSRFKGKGVDIQMETRAKIPRGNGETILVVEDDPAILKLTQKILDSLGYTVLTADTPEEALSLARADSSRIHLLITDVIMPEMNGRELADRLQTFYPDICRVFMSGYTADIIALHGVLDEGVFFIQKPFSRKALAEMVRKALQGKA